MNRTLLFINWMKPVSLSLKNVRKWMHSSPYRTKNVTVMWRRS